MDPSLRGTWEGNELCPVLGVVGGHVHCPVLWAPLATVAQTNVTAPCLLQAGKCSWRQLCGERAGSKNWHCAILLHLATWPYAVDTREIIYFFSLVRQGTRRNSMRADLGGSGVKSFSCSRKEENSYSSIGKWHDIDGNSLEWGERLGFDGICWHSLGNPGQNPLAKVKLASERTILSSAWEHSVCKSWITYCLLLWHYLTKDVS